MSLNHFPASYEASRARFRQNLANIQRLWPAARLERYSVDPDSDLTIDWISAEATGERQRQLIITCGEHGVEGYVGSAVMQLFTQEFLAQLDAQHTSLVLVHAINPWGMQNWRRVNGNNVDLNRNFAWDTNRLDATTNLQYHLLNPLVNPHGPAKNLALETTAFGLKLPGALLRLGMNGFKNAVLMGQYHTSNGVYFGGHQLQPETRFMMELFEQCTRACQHILHLDMHTGYGPRYQMSLVNSALESRSSADFARKFGYPQVVKGNDAEFYTIQGDMVDWLYHQVREECPAARLYATAFEFGTFGDSLRAVLRSMQAMIYENRLHQFGAANEAVSGRIRAEFREMFYPSEARWQEKALADARQALRGILRAEGFTG